MDERRRSEFTEIAPNQWKWQLRLGPKGWRAYSRQMSLTSHFAVTSDEIARLLLQGKCPKVRTSNGFGMPLAEAVRNEPSRARQEEGGAEIGVEEVGGAGEGGRSRGGEVSAETRRREVRDEALRGRTGEREEEARTGEKRRNGEGEESSSARLHNVLGESMERKSVASQGGDQGERGDGKWVRQGGNRAGLGQTSVGEGEEQEDDDELERMIQEISSSSSSSSSDEGEGHQSSVSSSPVSRRRSSSGKVSAAGDPREKYLDALLESSSSEEEGDELQQEDAPVGKNGEKRAEEEEEENEETVNVKSFVGATRGGSGGNALGPAPPSPTSAHLGLSSSTKDPNESTESVNISQEDAVTRRLEDTSTLPYVHVVSYAVRHMAYLCR